MNWNSAENKKLVEAVLTLKNTDEAKRFLRDLLTEEEIAEFATRLQTADMLESKIPYSVIAEKTGMSSTTIARVSKWLNNGMGGYKSVLASLHHHTPSKLGKGLSLSA